jgi:tetratricopeptide (TPR) repeat protein
MTVQDRRRIQVLSDYALARALEEQHSLTAAIAVLEEALKIEPESVPILRRLSRLCFGAGRSDQALEFGRRALQADPDDSETIERMIAHFARKRPSRDAALEAVDFIQSVVANPRLAKDAAARLFANHELAALYADHLNQPEKAADALAHVLEGLEEKAVNRYSPTEMRRILGDDPAEAYLEFGRVLAKAGRPALAIKAFTNALDYDPENPQAPLQLAEALLAQGKAQKALETIERFLKRQPNGSEGYELLAKALVALHREAEIIPRLESAAKTDPNNVLLQYVIADRYREAGQVEKAEAIYKALLKAQPEPLAYRALAGALLKRKKTEDLLRILVQALGKREDAEAIGPTIQALMSDREYALEVIDRGTKMLAATPPTLDRVGFQLLVSLCGRMAKSRDEAGESADLELGKLAELYRLAIKISPNALTFLQLAETQRRLSKYDEAAKTIRALLERYPDEKSARILVELAICESLAGQREEAVTAFRDALKLSPNDPEITLRLGFALSEVGKFDESIKTLRKALELDPGNVDVNTALGRVLSLAGKNEEAITLLKGLLERFPNNEDAFKRVHAVVSVIYINMGDYAKAEAELETVLERLPDDPGVNNDLGYLYADQGKKLEQAERMIRKALRGDDDKDNAAYLDSLGWVLFKRGKVKEAVGPLERAAKQSSMMNDPTIHEHLGDVYYQLKDYAQAKESWLKAERAGARSVPADKRLPEIRKKLKSLERLGTTPNPSAGNTP